jgi:hypothetical protein
LPDLSDDACTYEPPPATFNPVPLFTWGIRIDRNCNDDSDCQKEEVCNGGTCDVTWNHITPGNADEPAYHQVTSTPMVVDLDGDCVPEIIFNSYNNDNYSNNGILRAIRGDDGAKVWTLDDPSYRTDSTSNPAIGDVDHDGHPEIYVYKTGERRFFAIDWDGTPLWESELHANSESSGSLAIANVDGEGDAEIVTGAAIYDSSGNLVWEGNQGYGVQVQGPISCLSDIDGDGLPELVGGNTVYAFSGTIDGNNFDGAVFWNNVTIDDGYCGVADITGDGQVPEVVLVSDGIVYLLEGFTGTKISELAIPGGGAGGTPNIADFDGDGDADIGVAGGTQYAVMTFNGSDLELLWQAATDDASSARTGSSVFDFDGDGENEVVYGDEDFLRIYPGQEPDCANNGPDCDNVMTDAEVILREINSSRTRSEYPVIADANGDFKAEIVFSTSNEASFLDMPADAGVEVWRDQLDNWVPTRPVWNQHTYHISNVGVDGSIPDEEFIDWTDPSLNSYRRNSQGTLEFCAPDLVPTDLAVDTDECPDLDIEVRVVNQGCLGVGPGVNVAFYDANDGLLGVVQTQSPIVPGASELVTTQFPAPSGDPPYEIHAEVDEDGMDNGALNECVEDNNTTPDLRVCKVIG